MSDNKPFISVFSFSGTTVAYGTRVTKFRIVQVGADQVVKDRLTPIEVDIDALKIGEIVMADGQSCVYLGDGEFREAVPVDLHKLLSGNEQDE